MSGDGSSKLKLADPAGSAAKGNAAMGAPSTEDSIASGETLAEYKRQIAELERSNAELQKLQKSLSKTENRNASQQGGGSGKARHIAHAEGWQAICTAPDFCKVGKDIVAFNSFATLDQKQTSSPNVKARGTSVYRKGDVIKNVQGDAGEHIVSGTSLGRGHVKLLDGHENVKVNGQPVARHDSRCLINCDASGTGGAQGKIVTEQKTVGAESSRTTSAAETPPGERTSEKLEALKKAREQIAHGMVDFDAADEYIDFKRSSEILDGLIGKVSGKSGTAADYAAQAARGLLGFGKDFVMGAGELTYEAVKAVPKVTQVAGTQSGRLLAQVDAKILAENVKLGNISPDAAGRGAIALGKAVIKPVTDPWAKGQYVEALSRGVAEVGSLGMGWLRGGSATKAAKLGKASKTPTTGTSVATKKAAVARATTPSLSTGVHIKRVKKPEFSGNWSNYTTHGVKAKPSKSAEGRRMITAFEERGLTRDEAIDETINLMKTGSTMPIANPIEVGDKFYKVIPEGGTVGPTSAFWATKDQVLALKGMTYDQIADKLGVPLVSQQGAKFQVMEVTAFRPGTSFTSKIAPTTEIGANGERWSQAGGGLQTLLIDRSIFTQPKLVNIVLP